MTYLYKLLEDCVNDGAHLKSCDADGYCNSCGEQAPITGSDEHIAMAEKAIATTDSVEVTPVFEGTFAEVPATVVELPPDQSYVDFCKFDIRTGTITVAEKIKKKDRLLHLEVYLGSDIGTRTIVAGIAEHFSPDFLIGLQVMVVTNLEPRSLGGFTSHGMILAGKSLDGKLSLAGCMGVHDGCEIG